LTPLEGSYDKKKFRQKVVLDVEIVNLRYRQFSQNRHFEFSPVDFRYYRTFGKNPKNLVVEFFIGCWMQKTVWKYLALLKNGMGAKGGVT
jgi:hypothetical protein